MRRLGVGNGSVLSADGAGGNAGGGGSGGRASRGGMACVPAWVGGEGPGPGSPRGRGLASLGPSTRVARSHTLNTPVPQLLQLLREASQCTNS